MTTSVVDNGVNVEALLGARVAFADTPEIARFQWRSSVSWVNGTHSDAEVETFFGFGEEQQHSKRFAFDIDHPLQFAAEDNGITPVEYVLVALGARWGDKDRLLHGRRYRLARGATRGLGGHDEPG